MDQKKSSVDDILLEVSLSAKNSRSSEIDIDKLLNDIMKEKEAARSAPTNEVPHTTKPPTVPQRQSAPVPHPTPPAKPLSGSALPLRTPPKHPTQAKPQAFTPKAPEQTAVFSPQPSAPKAAPLTLNELPTRIFKKVVHYRQEKSENPQAPKEPPVFQKAPRTRYTPAKLPPIFEDFGHGKAATQPSAPPSKPQPSGEEPYKQKKQGHQTTGPIRVDVDAIRANQPAPTPVPAQSFEEEGSETRVRPVDLLRKKPARANEEAETLGVFAPCFETVGEQVNAAAPSGSEAALRKAAQSSLICGLITFVITLVILGLTLMVGGQRATAVPGFLSLGAVTVLGAAAGAVSYKIVGGGAWSLLHFSPDRDIMPSVAYLLCLAQSAGQVVFPKGLQNPQIQMFMAVGTLLLSGAWFARYMAYRTASLNAKFVFCNIDKYVPQIVADSRAAGDFTRGLVEDYGIPAVNRKTELLGNFLPISLSSDRSDMNARNFTLVGLILGIAAGVFTFFFTKHKNLAVTVLVAVVSIFTPMVNSFSVVHPLRRGAKALNRLGALACGERCVKDYGEVNAAVVDARQLFPSSAVILNGIKTFQGMRIDEAILDAASILIEAGSVLSDGFGRIISNRTELLRKVDSLTYEDNLGLSAWIQNRRILIGNRALMENHGIRAPSMEYEQKFKEEGGSLVYLATAGELTAVFVVVLRPTPETDSAIQTLIENDILLSVHTTDSFITVDLLSKLFLCESSCFKILPASLHERFSDYSQPVKIKPACVANNGALESMAAALAAPRRIKVMFNVCAVIQIVSVILGASLVLMLALLGALDQFSPIVACAYPLIWLLLGIGVQKLVRVI